MSLRLHYYRARFGNFGDDLNSWLWERLAPGNWNESSQTLFLGVGTIIGNPMPAAKKIIVFSTGFGYSPPPLDWGSDRWNVVAVRGPLTAQVLGLSTESVVADGALLLRHLPEFAPIAEKKRSGVVFVPHHFSARFEEWKQAAETAGVELLDPRTESRLVIQRLRTARLVLADSMHAAVIADTLRVPWLCVATSPQFSTFKWLDWTLSLGLTLETTSLLPPSFRVAYDNWAVRQLHMDHQVEPISAESAIVQQAVATTPPPNWLKAMVRVRPARALRYPLFRAAAFNLGRARLRESADQLRRLASQRGNLSRDSIVKSKADELLDRLKTVVEKNQRA